MSEREAAPTRRKRTKGHVCGWALVDGTWRCLQDFYAKGVAPLTACVETWKPR